MTYNVLSSSIAQMVAKANLTNTVLEYEPFNPTDFGGYPAVVVVPSEQRASFADTQRSEDHFFFDVRVHQEIPEQGAKNAEALLRQIVDSLMVLFNGDLTLGGALTGLGYMRPLQVRWRTDRSILPMERVAAITVEIVTVQ